MLWFSGNDRHFAFDVIVFCDNNVCGFLEFLFVTVKVNNGLFLNFHLRNYVLYFPSRLVVLCDNDNVLFSF